jgi:hypothetical protein
MGFSGGGSNITKAHTHDSTVVQDGGSLAANVTQFGLTSGSILYSDGSNIQELGVGAGAQVLGVSGSLPAWITNTSNPLIKVSKTFADIVVGTASMDIYTLPQDAALVNLWADITTVFDVSTAVTIGDAGDDNGFQEATDWTSGTGLTDATRGAYVTSFKTMRSTSGTTAISAYNFTTVPGSSFTQASGAYGRTISNGAREELAQQFNAGHVLIGEDVTSCSWFMKLDSGSPTGNIQSYIKQADGTIRTTSSTTVSASSLAGGSYVEHTFTFASTTIAEDDMLTVTLDNGTGGGSNSIVVDTNYANMTDGTCYENDDTASPTYVQLDPEQMKMTVA